MIENVGDAEKMSGQILREIVDKIMHEGKQSDFTCTYNLKK